MRQFRRIDLASLKMMFAIALAAMIVRAMVPVGWMIAHDPETGRITLELCSGKSTLAAPVQASQTPAQHHADHHDPHAHHMGHHDMAEASHDMHDGHGAQDAPGDHDHDYSEPACPVAMASVVGVSDTPALTGEPVVFASIDHELPPVRGPPAARIIAAPMPARGPPLFI